MQHVKNAIGGNAMKMLKMHQNALKCTRMRMGKINTTFGGKQHLSRFTVSRPPHPFRLSFHLCVRVVPVCVSSTLRSLWDSPGPVS